MGVNKTTVSYYRHWLIVMTYDLGLFEWRIEVDESYFGGRCKGERA